MEKQIPESWIDKDILLARNGATDSESVTLRQVSELGIAYSYKAGEVEGETVFVPWSSVSWMRPLIPGDLEETREGAG